MTLGTQIVARWLGDPAYHDREGRPRVLPRTPSKGGAESFAALVEKVSKNVRPRSVLDELVRLGVAEVDADDRVHLVTRGFVPAKELDAKAFYFGEALHDHLAAGVHNLEGGKPAWLERSVYYDELSPAAVAQLQAGPSTSRCRLCRKSTVTAWRSKRATRRRRLSACGCAWAFSFTRSGSKPLRPAGRAEKSPAPPKTKEEQMNATRIFEILRLAPPAFALLVLTPLVLAALRWRWRRYVRSGGIVGTGDAGFVSIGAITALGAGSLTVNGRTFGTGGRHRQGQRTAGDGGRAPRRHGRHGTGA